MRKFQEWVSFRENVPGTPEMSPGGNTPMPLGHTQGTPNPINGGPTAGQPPQGQEGQEDQQTVQFRKTLEMRLDKLMGELEKQHSMPKAQQVQLLAQVVGKLMSQFNMGKQTGLKAVNMAAQQNA